MARRVITKVHRRRRVVFGAVVLMAAVAVWSAGSALNRPAAGPVGRSTVVAVGSNPGPGAPAAWLANGRGGVYAHDGVGDMAAQNRGVPYLLYVPESAGRGVDVLDPETGRLVGHYATGLDPQHVVPSWDLKTLWATNDLANTMTPFDPRTGRPAGPAVPVDDPYNLYFTPDGAEAIVIAEQRQRLDFLDPHTMAPRSVLQLDCAGVDHADVTADGRYLVATCEFAGRVVEVDLRRHQVVRYVDLPRSSPQDIRLSQDGRTFYVADKLLGGVHLLDAASLRETGFLPTGRDAHGLYPSRDGTQLYVSNRGQGTISVISFATRQVVMTWSIPGGGSPDMGGVSPDGRVLWLSGRYNQAVYGISTTDGHLVRKLFVPNKPHGMSVWPQPGRHSLGHTGNMR